MSDQTLIELLYGKAAHTNPLACLQDVSLELAGRRTDHFPHSIFQLTSHMNYWMAYELCRIRGEKPPYPQHASESWPTEAAPSNENDWKAVVAQFGKLLGEMQALAESSPEILERPVEAIHPDHSRYSHSVHAVLWQTLVHNSYHIGQIAMLRRSFGAWPPPSGGDSW
ncbi:MAG TPA: DinB family protein [Candidatus Angelobacter sp.]|nr:DinB family protein [Candidatus Angelobacter sp.]